jgi:hypothetical protein
MNLIRVWHSSEALGAVYSLGDWRAKIHGGARVSDIHVAGRGLRGSGLKHGNYIHEYSDEGKAMK